MPQVIKQTARPGEPQQSILSKIRPVSQQTQGIKLCLYGRGKTGKTRLACTFPKPILIMGTEDGTKSVKSSKDTFIAQVERSLEVDELAEYAKTRYTTVVLDTAGGLQDLILKEVLGLDNIPVQKGWGFARREDWATTGMQIKERLRSVLTLADQGINVVIIAHERSFNNEEASQETVVPSIGAAISPTSANWLNGACDYICQAFIRQHEGISKQTIGVGKDATVISTKTLTGKMEYCLRIGPHPIYATGFRLDVGAELPDSIVLDQSLGDKMGYQQILALIEGRKL